MITRIAQGLAREMAAQFRIVAIVGPRQSGKTTLARSVFKDKAYVNLEEMDTRRLAQDDPRGFLKHYRDGAVIDEAQRCPELFSYLQVDVDETPARGRFILTGSQHFTLLESVSQSLAGRVGFVRLLPFSMIELGRAGLTPSTFQAAIFNGCYPPVHDAHASPRRWYDAYVTTYIERDVRQIVNVKNMSAFQRFIQLCAGNIGQLLNLTRIGADCGIDQKTAAAWINVLEASFILFRLPPHFRNFRKRLVKTPKLYFYDTGLACRLLGIESPSTLLRHHMRGPLFENWIITEWYKYRWNKGEDANAFFWRNSAGLEVDLLVDRADRLFPVEMKSGATLAQDWFVELAKWRELAGDGAERPGLVYGGDERRRQGETEVYSWKNLEALFESIHQGP
jgi:uncharacterized protein